jgi:predicted Fe-S protein YdhL (DUF1289 family)
MINSPCINKCTLVEGYCISCLRTTGEIAAWLNFSDDEKWWVIEDIQYRNFVVDREPKKL